MNTESNISLVSWTEQSLENQSYSDTNSLTQYKKIKENLRTIFNKRNKRIIAISIITILILVIITTIVPMISLRKSNNATNPIDISSNNIYDHTESISATTATIHDVGNGGISGDPPCSSHTVINDPSRNVNMSGIGGTCDNGPLFKTSIGGRWIRFIGKGGTMIPSYSPGTLHCSAYLASWTNATLPSTNGTLVNGIGCFETLVNTCTFYIPITIGNCGNFYVYFLGPVISCNARYCTI